MRITQLMPKTNHKETSTDNDTALVFMPNIGYSAMRDNQETSLWAKWLTAFFCFALCVSWSHSTQAATKREAAPWFEIEVILFSYSRSPANVKERFPLGAMPLPSGRKIDLLSEYHFQNITDLRQQLPTCGNQHVFGQYFQTNQRQNDFATDIPEFHIRYSINEEQAESSAIAVQQALTQNEPLDTDTRSLEAMSLEKLPLEDSSDSIKQNQQSVSIQNETTESPTTIDTSEPEQFAEIPSSTSPADFASTGIIDFLAINQELNQLYAWLLETNFPEINQPESNVESSNVEMAEADKTAQAEIIESELTIDWRKQWQTLQRNSQQQQLAISDISCNHYPVDTFSLFNQELPIDEYQYEELPRFINAASTQNEQKPHLLTRDELQLNEIYQTLRKQPDMRPILHTGWRQRGYQENTAIPMRLFAGIRYQKDFDAQGLARTSPEWNITPQSLLIDSSNNEIEQDSQESDTVQDNIQHLLDRLSGQDSLGLPETPTVQQQALPQSWKSSDPLWEIDGLFKIFMRGRYLNFDATFNVRRPSVLPAALNDAFQNALSTERWQKLQEISGNKQYLYNFQFSQKRRVITTEIHYFDHPFMGVVVQARRWGW